MISASELRHLGAKKREELLQNAFVIYGTSFQGANDAVATAVHDGLVPGAAVHAMALQNLLQANWRYVRRYPISTLNGIELRITLLDLVMLGLGALCLPRVRDAMHSRRSRSILSRLAGRAPSSADYDLYVVARYGTVFVTTFFCTLIIPFVLSAVVGSLAYATVGIAPVNFAAHAFVWLFVMAALDAFELLERPDANHRR